MYDNHGGLKCLQCRQIFINTNSLAHHLSQFHGLPAKEVAECLNRVDSRGVKSLSLPSSIPSTNCGTDEISQPASHSTSVTCTSPISPAPGNNSEPVAGFTLENNLHDKPELTPNGHTNLDTSSIDQTEVSSSSTCKELQNSGVHTPVLSRKQDDDEPLTDAAISSRIHTEAEDTVFTSPIKSSPSPIRMKPRGSPQKGVSGTNHSTPPKRRRKSSLSSVIQGKVGGRKFYYLMIRSFLLVSLESSSFDYEKCAS